ncbi:MAG: alpha/beta hydrolase [Burkholderiales bacterium]
MKSEGNTYDLLYNPRLSVPDFAQIAQRWNDDSANARSLLDCYLDVPYGENDAEKIDVFRAQGASKGLLVFIHGGYWRAQDKAGYSFLARALTQAGVTLAIPNYSLCPKVEVRDIVMQMVQACAWLYRNGSHFGAPVDRLFVCGHSAGGHLTAMMLTCLWPIYAADLPPRLIRAGLSISGIFDLREIVKVPSINCDVRLRRRDAIPISPALLPPATESPLHLIVGGGETAGFLFQHDLMRDKWKSCLAEDITMAGDNHFTVLENLTDAESQVFQSALRMMGI